MAWHLSEFRRFFEELALPQAMVDALRVDEWLHRHSTETSATAVPKNHVRQHGPVRDGARLDAALRELIEAQRVRQHNNGTRVMLRLSPALL